MLTEKERNEMTTGFERDKQIKAIHERLAALETCNMSNAERVNGLSDQLKNLARIDGDGLNELQLKAHATENSVEVAHNRIDNYASEFDALKRLVEKLVESAKNVEANFAILEKRADAICEDIERLKDWQLNGPKVLEDLTALQIVVSQMCGQRFDEKRQEKFDAGLKVALEKLPPKQISIIVKDRRDGAQMGCYDLEDLLVAYNQNIEDVKDRPAILAFVKWIREGAQIAPTTWLDSAVKVETTETRTKRIADLEQALSGMINNCYGKGSAADFNDALAKGRKLLSEA